MKPPIVSIPAIGADKFNGVAHSCTIKEANISKNKFIIIKILHLGLFFVLVCNNSQLF